MVKLLYPGTFDPLTKGHLDIAQRAKTLCDTLVVAVGDNPSKKPLFPVEERVHMWEIEGYEVCTFTGLLVDCARKVSASAILRSVRDACDYDYEIRMAQMNRQIGNDLETVFLLARPEFSMISSSLVREILSSGGDVSQFVPGHVMIHIDRLKNK